MRSSAKLAISLCSPEEASIILSSIGPDNEPLPPGLELSAYTQLSELVIEIGCGRALDSLLATIDDLLGSIGLAERVACRRGGLRYNTSALK